MPQQFCFLLPLFYHYLYVCQERLKEDLHEENPERLPVEQGSLGSVVAEFEEQNSSITQGEEN